MSIPVFHVDDKPLINNNLMQRASYISRETLHDDMYNKQRSPHRAKADRLYQQVLLPEQAPQKYKAVQDWTDKKNIEMLWNDVNATGYVRVARSYYAALPKEASLGEDIELVNSFVQEAFVSKGYIVQYDIHDEKKQTKKRQKKNSLEKRINTQLGKNDGNGNIHVHILVADMPCRDGKLVRARTENGKSKTVYIDMDGNKIDMIDTPILRKGKLQFNKDGSIKTKKGYQRLVVDKNGQPILDKEGKALLEDIRVATGTSKNGKYTKTTYKRLSLKTNPMDKIKEYDHETNKWENVNYQAIRKLWEKHHNNVIQKHNIKNENGKLATINMDSYAKQDKDKPVELQRKPQEKEWDKKNKRNHEAIANNQIIKKRNQNAITIKKLQDENAQLDYQIKKANNEYLKDKAIVEQIDPKAEWTKTWMTQATELYKITSSHYKYTRHQLVKTINAARKYIDELPKKLARKEQVERKRIVQHHNLMLQLEKNIQVKNLTESETIKKLAEEAWDKLTDQQQVSFVRDRYGFKTGKIYARVLAREKDDIDIVDGLEQPAPEIPDEKTNAKILEAETEFICETKNFAKYQKAAYAKWDTSAFKAPPQEVINVLDVCASVDGYYTAKLTKEPWKAVSTTGGFNYNIEEIEKEARIAREQLKKAEADAKAKAEAEATAKAKVETEQKQKAEAAAKAKIAAEQKQQAELIRQAELQKQQAEYRKQQVQIGYARLIPQLQLAVKQKDQDTVNKISTLVRSAFTEEEIETKYKGSKSWRDTEMNSMINKLIDIKSYGGINEDAKRELEKQIFDQRGKPILRTINKIIADHNQTATAYNQIDVKEYRKYSDEANFWYIIQNPDKAIRSKTPTAINGKTPEVQIEMPKRRQTKSLPAPSSERKSDQAWEVLPDGTTRPITVGPTALKKDADHEKSAMEQAEDELYQGWDPWKNGHGM